MKFKVSWTSPRQGIQSTTVDALNTFAAQEQVESMYAHIDGFRFISTTPVFEKEERKSEQSHTYHTPSSDGDEDFSAGIAGVGFLVAACAIMFGLFTLPSGIGAIIGGGAIGWLSWKLADWLSDRGW